MKLILYICFMKKIVTAKTSERLERHKQIKQLYKDFWTKGSQKTAVCQFVSEELGIPFSTVFRIINKDLKKG